MPVKPRGPIVYECDLEGCQKTIQGVPHSWWKASTTHPRYGFTDRRKHFFLCCSHHLIEWLREAGEAIVSPPVAEEDKDG